jgi:hypothetical protein
MVSKNQFKVLLVGSGLMTPPLVDYLISFKDTQITVASNLLIDAQNLCKRAPNYMQAKFLDVSDVKISFLSQLILGSSGRLICERIKLSNIFCTSMVAHASIISVCC